MLVHWVVIFEFSLFINTSNSSIISDITGGCSGSQCTGNSVGAVMLQPGCRLDSAVERVFIISTDLAVAGTIG